jgi:nicotinate-nucleotide adenylyltransferase
VPASARKPARRTRAARFGVFGGTFDPPHLGHLAIAEWARDRLSLDRVIFVPAGQPPHKRDRGRSAAAARLAMTRLATRGQPGLTVSEIEVDRNGPSFTVDTLRELERRHPRARWYLILGADSLDDFATWKHPHEIARLATLVVAGRPASRSRTRRAAHAAGAPRSRRRVVRLDNPEIAISSSLVRARVRAGRSIRGLVPDSIARYIARHGLYRTAEPRATVRRRTQVARHA